MLVAGIDSSTQSTKIVLCRAEDGEVLAQASSPHPDGTECDPRFWWEALTKAGAGLLDRADAIGVAAQQHGLIVLDEQGQTIRPALLWNDLRSAAAAASLIDELGGPGWWASATGSVPTAAFTVTKLRWLAVHEPLAAARVARVLLPHDWLTWRLSGVCVTDRGDASGTGYFSPASGEWLPSVASAALGHAPELPRLAAPGSVVGQTAAGIPLSAGTGDNMGAALGLGVAPGEVVVSIGTSGTAYAVATGPAADETGAVAGFCDATGRFLPLVCTMNAARVMSVWARMLGVGQDEFDALALAAPPGAEGLTLLPYLDGERTPNRPSATGVLRGLTSENATPANMARAAVEAVLCSLADALGRLTGCGVPVSSVLLIGGGAKSAAVRAIAPAIFGVPVTVPAPAEYVALGAARQAAWALSGQASPPSWPRPGAAVYEDVVDDLVLARYASLRDATASWLPERVEDRALNRRRRHSPGVRQGHDAGPPDRVERDHRAEPAGRPVVPDDVAGVMPGEPDPPAGSDVGTRLKRQAHLLRRLKAGTQEHGHVRRR
jgi:xylulokinase